MSRNGVDWRAARQRAFIPSFLPVNVLVNLIAVNQMDLFDYNSSNGGSEFPGMTREHPIGNVPTEAPTIPLVNRNRPVG